MIVRTTNSSGAVISGETKGYYYDSAWNLNRRTNSSSGSSTTFSVDSKNQLTAGPHSGYSYDSNGNLTLTGTAYDGYTFSYDAENRLVQVNTYHSGFLVGYVLFQYDGLGRLRTRSTYYNDTLTAQTKYIYDGMRVIQERDVNNTPEVSYTRGTDLSGSIEGAGGIGGLVARSHGYSSGTWSTHNHYHADGNGNITYLVNSSQTVAASYRYDAYGNTISSSGGLASANVYRFSSKESRVIDLYAGNDRLYYYGYRFYDPNLQRWLNRDPIGELGFRILRKKFDYSDNQRLFTFVENNPVTIVDSLGLTIWVCTVRTSGFPLYGVGRHAYFWDDRMATPEEGRECGREGAYGSGGNASENIGPRIGDVMIPWRGTGPRGDTECYPIEGSYGREDAIMNCCKKDANKGAFIPLKNDCHDTIDNCLKKLGLAPPPHPRFTPQPSSPPGPDPAGGCSICPVNTPTL
jgi:RHS repeat-associated protein